MLQAARRFDLLYKRVLLAPDGNDGSLHQVRFIWQADFSNETTQRVSMVHHFHCLKKTSKTYRYNAT
jgi:hypothetical protein